jgi:hypothetical protein
MGIERRTETIPASGVTSTPRGNYFLLLTANAAVNLRAEARGTSEGFNGVIGGVFIRRKLPWDFIEIIGVAGTTLEYFVGHEEVTTDETDIRLAVSVIAGAVTVNESPGMTISDIAPVVVATGGEGALFAANAARKRVRVYADGNNGGACYARPAGASVNNIAELQPGMFHEFKTIAGLDVRNDTGGNATFYIFEES